MKSAVGIGTLLEDGIGDTIRVSLTEDPELEIPVCRDLVKRYSVNRQPLTDGGSTVNGKRSTVNQSIPTIDKVPYNPFSYSRRKTFAVDNIGGHLVPVVIADLSKLETITPDSLQSIGYTYNEVSDKWNISDGAADYIFTADKAVDFALPGTLKVISYYTTWQVAEDKTKFFPLFDGNKYLDASVEKSSGINFVEIDCYSENANQPSLERLLEKIKIDKTAVLCLSSSNKNAMQSVRRMVMELKNNNIENPVILSVNSSWQTADEHLIHYATEAGALLLDGFGDGICLGMTTESYKSQVSGLQNTEGRTYTSNTSPEQFINSTAFTILQATRVRISKTEYISCPSCGRTLFDLQETTAKIRSVTNHLKGVKIAIMGCIVNGPGEMADADFGYVGSGVGKITLYKGKEVVKKNIDSAIAVDELINLLKENEAWVEA